MDRRNRHSLAIIALAPMAIPLLMQPPRAAGEEQNNSSKQRADGARKDGPRRDAIMRLVVVASDPVVDVGADHGEEDKVDDHDHRRDEEREERNHRGDE